MTDDLTARAEQALLGWEKRQKVSDGEALYVVVKGHLRERTEAAEALHQRLSAEFQALIMKWQGETEGGTSWDDGYVSASHRCANELESACGFDAALTGETPEPQP